LGDKSGEKQDEYDKNVAQPPFFCAVFSPLR